MSNQPVLTNRTRAWGFVQSEANFARSRDRVTLDGSSAHLLGQSLFAGQVLAEVTATSLYVPWNPAASDGSQNAQCILGEDAKNISGDPVVPVLARDAEVRVEDLTFAGTQAALAAGLETAYANGFGRILIRILGGVQAGDPSNF